MKKVKQVAALILTLCMMIGLPMAVSAAGDSSFAITGTEIDGNGWFRITFNQALKNTSGYLNNLNTKCQMGLAWVKNSYDPNGEFADAIEDEAIFAQNVVYNGDVTQILWKASEQGVDIYEELSKIKDGCVLKFFFYDNGCAWNGQGAIGAVQNANGGSLPCYDRGYNSTTLTHTKEYLFVDITYDLKLTEAKFIGENQVLFAFNKPIAFITDHYVGLSLYNSSNDMMAWKLNTETGAYEYAVAGTSGFSRAQWGCSIDWKPFGESGRLFLATINGGVTSETIRAIVDNSGYDLRLRIQENTTADGYVSKDSRVNTIWAKDGNDFLTAAAKATQEQAWISLSDPIVGDAMIGMTAYNSLDGALAEATPDTTVTLISSVKQAMVMIPADVTLDLAGYTVTTNALMGFGYVVDGTDGTGKVVISKDGSKGCTHLQADNPAMPLYDTDGYRFYSFLFESKEDADHPKNTDDVNVYKMRLVFDNANAYTLLASDENTDMVIGVNLLVENADGSANDITYKFRRTTIAKLTANNALTLMMSGVSSLGDATLTATAVVTSPTRVALTGDMPQVS